MKVPILILLAAGSVQAQFSTEDLLKPHVYTNETGETLVYRSSAPQFPAAGKKYPLILFLHGSGECGSDNLRQITQGAPALMSTLLKRQEPVVVVAPQCQSSNWWVRGLAFQSNYAMSPRPADSLRLALELCHSLMASGLVDSNRLYITGLSLGGFGTWDAIQREPTLFAAAMPLCGGGDIRCVQPLKKLPIWVFHGHDDKNVPVDCSRRMVLALRQAGNPAVRYTEYEKAAHTIWDRTYADPEAIDWLLKQSRVEKPWWHFW